MKMSKSADELAAEAREQSEDAPITSSERYAMLARFSENHRYGLSDMPGQQTVDMLLTYSRSPIPPL
jgi:hypothetical protein